MTMKTGAGFEYGKFTVDNMPLRLSSLLVSAGEYVIGMV